MDSLPRTAGIRDIHLHVRSSRPAGFQAESYEADPEVDAVKSGELAGPRSLG